MNNLWRTEKKKTRLPKTLIKTTSRRGAFLDASRKLMFSLSFLFSGIVDASARWPRFSSTYLFCVSRPNCEDTYICNTGFEDGANRRHRRSALTSPPDSPRVVRPVVFLLRLFFSPFSTVRIDNQFRRLSTKYLTRTRNINRVSVAWLPWHAIRIYVSGVFRRVTIIISFVRADGLHMENALIFYFYFFNINFQRDKSGYVTPVTGGFNFVQKYRNQDRVQWYVSVTSNA